MKTVLAILLTIATLCATETKGIRKIIPVKNSQTVELLDFTGSDIEIKSWDKNEVSINIKIDYSSSNKEKQEEYYQKVDVVYQETGERIKISYKEPKMHTGFSWKDFFSFNFSSYTNMSVTGEIYVPASSPLSSDMRYGTYSVDGLKGNLELSGTGNKLTVRNCISIQKIANNYGTTTIEHSGGSLDLEGVSSTISVDDFNGTIDANADYSTIDIKSVTKDLTVKCSSGHLDIDDVRGNLTIDADYSTITAVNIKGMVTIGTSSGKIHAKQVGGVHIDAPYSTMKIETVSGTGEAVFVKSSSGKIEISNVMGDIKIEDSYSKVQLSTIQGNVNLDGEGTGVLGKKITGNMFVRTQYADVDVRELSASTVEISNKSSKVDIQLLTKPLKVEIVNEYGPVDITFPEYSGDVKFRVSYGTIKTNLPVDVEEIGDGAIASGKVGNGTGSMYIKTVSGNIEVYQRK